MDQLLALDRMLFLFFNGSGNILFDNFFLLLSHPLTNGVVYFLAWLFLTQKLSWKSAALIFMATLLLILITDQTTNLAKFSFARLRPCYDPDLQTFVRLVKASCGGQYSFFSGHASNSFALAVFFGGFFQSIHRYVGFFFLGLASFIAYSRIYLGVHFPLDILVGALVGSGFGKSAYLLFTKFISLEYR